MFAVNLFFLCITTAFADDRITLTIYPQVAVTSESLMFVCTVTNATSNAEVHLLALDETVSNNCGLHVDNTTANISCKRDPTFEQYNVTIYHLQKSLHEGLWTCIEFSSPLQWTDMEIHLLERADKPIFELPGGQYVEDQEYNLTCSTNAVDPYPTFFWWLSENEDGSDKQEFDGPKIEWNGTENYQSYLTFIPTRTKIFFYAWCSIDQPQLGPQDSDIHNIEVIYPPGQAVAEKTSFFTVIGVQGNNTVDLICSLPDIGNPRGTFEWTRWSGQEVTGNSSEDGRLTLFIDSVEYDDVYSCLPGNAAGKGQPDNVTVTVWMIPTVDEPSAQQKDIHYNETISIPCCCSARPKATASWQQFNPEIYRQTESDSVIIDERNLTIQTAVYLEWATNNMTLRRMGSGSILCNCSNEIGSNQKSADINILFPPLSSTLLYTFTPPVFVTNEEQLIEIACVVTYDDRGNPADYNYTWTRHTDHPIDDWDPKSQNLSLSVSRNSLCLDNVYTCAPTNSIGTASGQSINLSLLVTPEIENNDTAHVDVRYDNNTFVLRCVYNAKPVPEVKWEGFNEQIFDVVDLGYEANGDCDLLTRSGQKLVWAVTSHELDQRKNGSGLVSCAGNNGFGGTKLWEVFINVQYGPGAPALQFTDNMVYAGGTAAMTCSFTPGTGGTDGNPTVTEYTWQFRNKTLIVNNSSHVTFVVTSVTQEGQYVCYGTNHPVGGSSRGDDSQPEYLTVNVYPYLVQPSEPSDTVIVLYNDDQNTSLSCLGAGKPEVDFNWYHNGDQVDEEDFIEEKDVEAGEYLYDLQYGWRSYLMRAVGGAYFTCDNITKYDGHYQCEAYIGKQMSNMSAPVRLITHYPAHWAGPVLHPKLYTSPGDNFTLLCDVCMEPRGNITWYMNGEPVRDNVSITDDGRNLTLTDVQLEDFGNYTCQVASIILDENYTESFDISLVERGAPHTPQTFHVDDSTSRSLNVSWMPGSTGGYGSQTFTLCYVTHDVHPSCQVGITDPGGSDAISKSLGDLKANTTYQLRLYAENAHHGVNRSSLTTINNSTKVAPVIKIVDFDLSATHVIVTWVVEAGEPSYLTLVHCPAEDCDVTTQRSRRDVKPTWRELATNIPPDEESYTYEAEEDEPFDVYSRNRFNLWAYEPGLNDRSNTDDDDAIWDVLPLSRGMDIGLVVGIVLAVVAAAALATGGFVFYRKKATKGPSHREIGQDNLGMSPDGVENQGYDVNGDIEPYGEVSFNDPPQSKPAASNTDPPSDVGVEYAQVVKPKKKAKAAADASVMYSIVNKTQKKTKTPGPVPEDETQDPYENVDFPKNKIEYLDKEPYYLSKDGLIYVNLLKKGPEVIHETAYEPSDYKTIDWVRTAQINKHPRPPTPPDTPPPRAEKYDDEEDIFGPLPFQAKEEEEQDGDFDEENVDYEDDGTRPTHATVTASMTQHSRREQVPEGAVGGVEDHEMDSGHSSPRGQFFSST